MTDPAVTALAAQVRRLEGEVFALRARLDDIAVSAVPEAPTWLLDSPERNAQLDELITWVNEILRQEYHGYWQACDIRECWPHHTEALWELATLRASWRLAYDRPVPSLPDAVAWHDKLLPGVLGRLGKVQVRFCQNTCILLQ